MSIKYKIKKMAILIAPKSEYLKSFQQKQREISKSIIAYYYVLIIYFPRHKPDHYLYLSMLRFCI